MRPKPLLSFVLYLTFCTVIAASVRAQLPAPIPRPSAPVKTLPSPSSNIKSTKSAVAKKSATKYSPSPKYSRFFSLPDAPIPSPIVVSVPVAIKPTPTTNPPWYAVSLNEVLPSLITLTAQICLALFGFILFKRHYNQRERQILEERDRFEQGQKSLQNQFEKVQQNTLYQFERKQEQDRILAEAKAAEDKRINAWKEIQDQYRDIQNRFAQIDPALKVSAAIRLGEFAETLDPETPADTPRTAQSRRYFIPVAQQLASALVLEEEVAVRNAIRDALKRMTLFAAKESEQALLHELITVLAEANRRSKDAFINVMGEWAVAAHAAKQETLTYPTGILMEKDIDLLAQMTPFCARKEETVISLHSLMADKEERIHRLRDFAGAVAKPGTFARAKRIYAAKRSVQNISERVSRESHLLLRLETAGQQLIDARETLVTALRMLEAPKSFKTSSAPFGNIVPKEWSRLPSLDLSYCFLAGAAFEWAHLQGVDLTGVHLTGANLSEAQLQEANLAGAQLQRACLRNAKADGAKLTEARLENADLQNLSLRGATLTEANLTKANLKEAHLDRTNLSYARLDGADLRLAYLSDAFLTEAHLTGADLTDAHLVGADLRMAHLGGASLTAAHLEKANLMGTQLRETNLRLAHLEEANLRLAHLRGAYLREAHLEGANLWGAGLEGAYLYGVYVQEQETDRMPQTRFEKVNFRGAKFAAADPNWQIVDGDIRTERVKEWLAETFPEEWATWTGDMPEVVTGDNERAMIANVLMLVENGVAPLPGNTAA